jgi:poly(3-hydroxybutyrate) depolymerase
MKQLFTLCLLRLFIAGQSFAQSDCVDGRYTNYTKFSQVDVTSAVTFGSNNAVGGGPTALKMDIYEPIGDTETDRAVVLVAFGGSFVSGSRADVAFLCNILAKLGYVAVAPDYRVGLFSPNQRTTTLAVLRGAHDMKAAIRYLKKTASEDGNPYGIDCERIIASGISAGAIAAIHAAYLDRVEETPSYLTASDTAGLGGIEGNSGTPNYTSDPLGVMSFSGAIGDSSWIEAGDPAIGSIHEELDGTVPYLTQEVSVFGIPTGLIASGSADIHIRATNLGLTNELLSYPGVANHVGYFSPIDQDALDFMRDFLADLVCSGETNNCEALPSGISEMSRDAISVYPNPTNSELNFRSEENGLVEVVDATGRVVLSNSVRKGQNTMDVSAIPAGVYTLKMLGNEVSTAHFIKQ